MDLIETDIRRMISERSLKRYNSKMKIFPYEFSLINFIMDFIKDFTILLFSMENLEIFETFIFILRKQYENLLIFDNTENP